MSRKANYPKHNAVIVKWLDSTAHSGWRDTPGSPEYECVSVGNLIRRDKKGVLIAMNRSHFGHGDFMDIPACAVKSVKKLKE